MFTQILLQYLDLGDWFTRLQTAVNLKISFYTQYLFGSTNLNENNEPIKIDLVIGSLSQVLDKKQARFKNWYTETVLFFD